MSEVTAPIMTDATGQSIDSKLNSLLGKMDNLAAAFQPNASGIVYSNTTSGLTGDDVQEAIDEMAADVSEIKSSLSLLDFISNVQASPASGTDLNSLKTNAIYQVGNWTQYTNPPTGIGYSGCLIVFVVRSYVLQIAYSDSGKKHRFSYNGGSSWNAWI